MDTRHERLQEGIREGAAEFLAREASRQSLVTVTRAMLSEDSKSVIIYMTAFPESAEGPAVAFANRYTRELAHFLSTRIKGGLPRSIKFQIDMGEKNRRRLDELS